MSRSMSRLLISPAFFLSLPLAPGRPHYLRVLVESPRGKIWSFETDRFSTRP